jgi:hypothetical protein
MRYEARLLLEDADALAAGEWMFRTDDERRADAFEAMVSDLTAAAQQQTSQQQTSQRQRPQRRPSSGATRSAARRKPTKRRRTGTVGRRS